MKNINILSIVLLLITPPILAGGLHLPEIISSDMVLQQQTNVNLWGKAVPNSVITISPDWQTDKFFVRADKNGRWITSIPTPEASFTPHTITFTTPKDTIRLTDILIGEVWFASGQSNMEMPLNGFWNCPVNDNNEAIATAAEWADKIRFVTIPKTGAVEPQDEVEGKWQIPSPSTAPWISAAAWYFAQMTNRVLQCPVGVIVCAWGGSRVEGWTPRDTLLTYNDVNLEEELRDGWNGKWWEYYTPLVMYNGMFYPVRHYTFRGFLWYQGEANVGKDADYVKRLDTMVRIWRRDAGDRDNSRPFYLTEIAPWAGYGEWLSGPLLREAQHKAGRVIPNSGCICTNDLVMPDEINKIHPAEKRQVGYRLAYMALNRTYGYKDIACDAPEYDHHEIHGDTIEVFCRYADDGLSPWQDIQGFEIADDNLVFYPAQAIVNEDHKTLMVYSKDVQNPTHLRYCFKAFSIGNVRNHRNLPLVPFQF